MNDLSNSSDPQGSSTPVVPPTATMGPSGNKEVEGGRMSAQESLQDSTGQEFELPKEVVSAGVRTRPTVVSIPPTVAQMGVKPAGHNIPVQTTSSIILPLTDDQIAAGLHQGVTTSWRWLSTWCIRRLKQIHVTVKTVHGKLIRVKT